jgi:hypothetical protein
VVEAYVKVSLPVKELLSVSRVDDALLPPRHVAVPDIQMRAASMPPAKVEEAVDVAKKLPEMNLPALVEEANVRGVVVALFGNG